MTRPARFALGAVSGLMLLALAEAAVSQSTGKTYKDSRGKAIVFPLGDASFADEVVSFQLGTPAHPDKRWATEVPAARPRSISPTAPGQDML